MTTPKITEPKAKTKIRIVSQAELDAAMAIAKERMGRARTRLLMHREFRFFATLALHLEPTPAPGLGTMATDGTHMYYDPLLVASDHWSLDELVGVNAHEASHCALLHHVRMQNRDPQRWNYAADLVINEILKKAGFKLPKEGLFQKDADQYSVEQTYDRLPKPPPQQQGSSQGEAVGELNGQSVYDPGGCGAVIKPAQAKGAANAKAAVEAEQRKWTVIARQAAAIAQAQGHLPGGFEHLLEPTKTPIDPWAVLRQFVDLCRAEDYSYSRPNRRYIGEDLHLPTLYSEGIGTLLIGVDTSGSISDKQLAAALGFVAAVVADVRPSETHLLQCDAGVHSHEIFRDGLMLPKQVKVTGRGGTSMAPIWKHAEKHDVQPVVSVVLTDMEMSPSDFGCPQDFPVLWLNLGHTEKAKAPFGETVYVELP